MSEASNLILLSNQMALSRAMDVVANNIANASTTGFKREGIAFDALLSDAGAGKTPTSFVYDRATYRDASNGPIVGTGNPLDLAIQGQGYFQVQTPDGKIGYTRAGTFQLNADGQLVTPAGLALLGDGGQAILIPQTASQINISKDGYVTARIDNGAQLAQIGKIGLVKFDNEQAMQATGNNTYTTNQPAQPSPDSAIVQGSIEQSNVQPVIEITNLIRIMRSYEQATNMISNENQRQTDAVGRLSKTSS